jgi:hypothetical protein
MTVPGETLSTAAVSSMLIPPKKRSSTIRLLRGSVSPDFLRRYRGPSRWPTAPAPQSWFHSEKLELRRRRVLTKFRCRARSTRIWRISRAAIPKKCDRSFKSLVTPCEEASCGFMMKEAAMAVTRAGKIVASFGAAACHL